MLIPVHCLKSAHENHYEDPNPNENVIEVQDLEHKCKNLTKEAKFSCERRIEEVRSEIGAELQKLIASRLQF